MSLTRSYGAWRPKGEHFEPNETSDPKSQRHLHAKLEQIDYTTYAANRKQIADRLGKVDVEKFERLAAAAARARCEWVLGAFSVSGESHQPSSEQIKKLTELRTAYEELAEAYAGLRRLVERGYLSP